MNSEKNVFLMVFLVFIIFLSLLVPYFSGYSYSSEKEIILVEVGEGENIRDREGLELLEEYGNNALVRTGKENIRILRKNGFRINELPSRTMISVRGHTFDISEGEPDLDPDMKIDGYQQGEEGLYLIHMLGPINPRWIDKLMEKDIEIINYVPNYAYEVRMTPEKAEDVKDLFFVDWVGIYHPAYKLPAEIESEKVNVRFVPEANPRIVNNIRSSSIVRSSINPDGTIHSIIYNFTSHQELRRLATINDVYSISEYIEPKLHSEIDAQIIGGGAWIMDDEYGDPSIPYRKHGVFGAYINQIGYSGENVTIAVADTGIGEGRVGDAGHPDLTGRVIGGYGFGRLDEDDWRDGHGHGTHVTGSVAGNSHEGSGEAGIYPGFGSYYMGQGLAYDSELYAAKIFSDAGRFLVEDDYYSIIEIPKQESKAYIHTNSWGSSTEGAYIEFDKIFDQAVRDANRDTDYNEPMIITVSAGNSGAIEQSIGSPGNAKNVITVGATESYMPDGGDYGGSDTENPNQIARFSSRGWTEDNRVKPDVVAPGQNVLSLGNPTFSDGATYDWKSGTSMSNPTVAGAAAVTVEWYEKNFGERPSPAMVKSLLINTAHDIQREECRSEHIPNKDEGWGMVDISKLEYPKDDPVPFLVEDQTSLLQTGESDTYEIKVDREGVPLKISLVWTDKNAMEGDEVTLKNDLNLKVESPSGKTYRGNAFSGGWTQSGQSTMEDFDRKGDGWDDVNNVQNIYILPDEIEEGKYSIKVDGFNIPEDGTNDGVMNQDYALVIYNGKNSEMDTGPRNRPIDFTDEAFNDDSFDSNNYSERDTIHIDGDEEFETKVEKEGWSGSGTEDEPFVIDGYTIDGGEKNSPISIENVGSYFVVKNNKLFNANRSKEAISGHSGIYLSNTENGRIYENKLELNSFGILMENSYRNTIENNTALNNHVGIRLSSSNENIIRNNDARKISHPTYDEGIYLEESENNSLLNNRVVNNHDGLLLYNSNRNLLRNNNASYNTRGLRLDESEFNEINGGNLWKNSAFGLYVFGSDENEFLQIESVSNTHGAYLRSSERNLLMANHIKHNRGTGIRFSFSDRNNAINNTVSENGGDGLSLYSSQNHTISGNKFLKDGINLLGDSIEDWNTHTIDINNTVEGKPIHYLSNLEGAIIDENTEAGQIILANSTDIVIEDQHIDTGDVGLILGFSDGNTIRKNTITNQIQTITLRHSHGNRVKDNQIYDNYLGLYLVRSNKNSISENNLSGNELHGLVISSSNNNLIFGNELSNNDVNALYLMNSYDNTLYHNKIYHSEQNGLGNKSLAYDNGINRWDHRSEGNHWSNYEKRYPKAEEIKGIGKWDTSYEIEGSENKDKYPLSSPESVDDLSVVLIEPIMRETVFTSDVKVRWDSKGSTGELSTWIRLNGEYWIEIDVGQEYTFENLSDGHHEVEVRVEDDHDVSLDHAEFEVNTYVFVEITRPESGSIERRSTVAVEWLSQNMEHNEIRLEGEGYEGEGWIDVNERNQYIFRNIPDGRYTVSVRAIDEEGNHYQDSVAFSVKTVAIEIQSPVEDEIFGSPNVTIRWNSENAVSHEIRICGGRWDRIGDVDKHVYTNLKPGYYEISVRARDETGRSRIDSISFTVDTTPPLIQIIEPSDGDVIISDRLDVKWEGEDKTTQIARYEIRIDGGEWIDVGTDTQYTFEELESGNYTIEVRAWDKAGNSEVDIVTIEIVEEEISLRLRDYWWLLSVVAVILIILLDIIFWRGDDKRKIPREGRLIRLQKELHREESKDIEQEYKL